MPIDLLVVGAGGFGRETLDVVEAMNRGGVVHRVIGIADDAPTLTNLRSIEFRGYRHLGSIAEVIASFPPGHYVLAIGDPVIRESLSTRFDNAGWIAATLIHPSAVVGSLAEIAPGCIICGGTQISTNVHLGRHVHLNPNCTIGHDTELAEFVSINPAAVISGKVRVAPRVLIGTAAVVLQGLEVGHDAVVGASACVTKNVPTEVVVKGIPGRWA